MTAPQFSPKVWLQWQEAFVRESSVALRRWAALPAVWKKAGEVRKGATPSEVVYTRGPLRLLHYLGDTPPQFTTPALFVFALVNRPYILDLKPERSVIRHFVQAGFDTYLVDWGKPGIADRRSGFDDYINGALLDVVDFLRHRTGEDQVNMLGYCMGGTMSSIFTALHQDRVKNLLLLAAGIDFATRAGLLNLWTRPEYFDVDKFVDAYGNCPAAFLQASFLMLRPVQNLIEKPIHFFEHLEDGKFMDDFLTTETWLNDNIPVAGEIFREFVKYLYQQNLLVQDKLRVGGRTVRLGSITCPVMNIMAQSDDLVPCSQSMPFNDLVGSSDRESILFPAGHIGLAIGSKAQKEVWPKVCDWLAERY